MKITNSHLDHFYCLLNVLNRNFPLNIEGIKDVIEKKAKFNFPAKSSSAETLAVTHDIRDKCLPYVPMISITAQENHLSNYVGLLELKIQDLRTKRSKGKGVGFDYTTWLLVAPSGRTIFGMDGVTLDSSGKLFLFNENLARISDQFSGDPEFIRVLRKSMLQAFNPSGEKEKEYKEKILKIFNTDFNALNN